MAPKEHEFWWRSYWVAEAYNYFPNGDIIITSRDNNMMLNMMLKNPEKMNKCQMHSELFYLTAKESDYLRSIAEEDVSDAIKSGALLIPKGKFKDRFYIQDFGKEPVTYFLFRKNAQEYALHLLNCYDVLECLNNLVCVKKIDKPFAVSLDIDDQAFLRTIQSWDWAHSDYPICAINLNAWQTNPYKSFCCGMRWEKSKKSMPTKGTIDEKVETPIGYKTHTCKDFID